MKNTTEEHSSENGKTIHKVCGTCKTSKSKSSFNKDRTKGDGLQTQCRECKHKAQKSHYERLKPDYMEKQRGIRAANPEMRTAHQSVHRAIKAGILIRPDSCPVCGNSKMRIEAHHHKGYEKEFALDVLFLCTSCHRAAES